MTRQKRTISSIIIALFVLPCLAVMFVRAFFRPVHYVVVLEPGVRRMLFDCMDKGLTMGAVHADFVGESALRDIFSRRTMLDVALGSEWKIAGRLSLQRELPFVDRAYIRRDQGDVHLELLAADSVSYSQYSSGAALLQRLYAQQTDATECSSYYYHLQSRTLLPTVRADFTGLSPELDLRFAENGRIPEGYRALPVEGLYAGMDGYQLAQECYLVCTVYEARFAAALKDWCDARYAGAHASQPRQQERPVFVASVGDIMVARGAQEAMMQERGLGTVFGNTLPILRRNDITMGNLEGVVTDSEENATKTYTFRFKKAVLPYLRQAGFTYLMQANNHCYDYGEAGFRDTLAALAEYDIPTSGAGHDAEEARRFYHTSVRGQPFAIISCGAFSVERSGFNGKKDATATETRAGILWEDAALLEQIGREKAAGNFVIVNVHGGEEYQPVPNKRQRRLYESFCDAGADVVFGSHPHVVQASEWYGRSLIVYSQGNFLFNGMEDMPGATDSEIVRLGILDGRIAYVEHYPARLEGVTVSLR